MLFFVLHRKMDKEYLWQNKLKTPKWRIIVIKSEKLKWLFAKTIEKTRNFKTL